MARRELTFRMPVLLTWVGIAVLAAVVAVLVLAALRLGADAPTADRPLPEVAPALPAPAAEAAPEPAIPEPQPELAPAGAALSVAGDGVLWRSTAAVCTPNTAPAAAPPVIERSENGTAWAAVTPATVDVREVLWLQALDGASAEAVVLTGPACEPQVLRTFTAGDFWQAYPNSLTGAITVDAAAGQIVTATGTAPLPCAAPLRAVTGAAAPTVLCTGQVMRLLDGAWQPLPLGNVVAAAGLAADGTLTTVREGTADCAGVLLERRAAAGEVLAERCVPGTGVRAVAAAGERTWLWTQTGVEGVTWEQ